MPLGPVGDQRRRDPSPQPQTGLMPMSRWPISILTEGTLNRKGPTCQAIRSRQFEAELSCQRTGHQGRHVLMKDGESLQVLQDNLDPTTDAVDLVWGHSSSSWGLESASTLGDSTWGNGNWGSTDSKVEPLGSSHCRLGPAGGSLPYSIDGYDRIANYSHHWDQRLVRKAHQVGDPASRPGHFPKF